MRIKDYYKILEVFPTSPLQEIKRSYRKLAFKYHPDQNPDNTFAEAHFKEITEAYDILSNPGKRKRYDEERWLSGLSNRMVHQQAITPEWIASECLKLSRHMAVIDTYRMSHGSLHDYIHRLLSDSHMGVLQHYNDVETNRFIIGHILKATARLQAVYMESITVKLVQLAGADNALLAEIYTVTRQRKKQAGRSQALPLIITIITLLLCLLMYLYGRR